MGWVLHPACHPIERRNLSVITRQTVFRKHIALPQDHGSWVFLLSPLLIGLLIGGSWSMPTPFLILAAFSAFLLRQPMTIATKAYSGRRTRQDLPAAWFWIAVYSVLGLLALTGLVLQGFGYLMYLALAGVPVFAWHLYLVSRQAERRQMGVELVGTGVLALVAPAAFWVAQGRPDPAGWWLFGLAWFQSAASIVYAYLRLEQRFLKEDPPMRTRVRMGARALAYTSFNLLAVAGMSLMGWLPSWLFIPYGVQWVETIYGVFKPAIGERPVRIGLRQLIVSSLFTLLFILTWNL